MRKIKQIKKKNSNKGITLIALVITIIVLLILAAVSIATLTGENGILTKANDASETSKNAEEDERVKLAVATALSDNLGEGLTTATLKDAIGKEFGEDKRGNLEGDGPWTFKGEKKTYIIEITGKITEKSNYEGKPLASEVLKVDSENKTSSYVQYVDKNGENILCKVLYDKKYNEDNNKNYGIQIVSVDSLCVFEIGHSVRVEDFNEDTCDNTLEYDHKMSILYYNNAIKELNDKADEYRNPSFSDVGGARCIGSLPDKPDSEGDFVMNPSGPLGVFGFRGAFRDGDENYVEDVNQLKVISAVCTMNGTEWFENTYWLASRYIWDERWLCVRHFYEDYESVKDYWCFSVKSDETKVNSWLSGFPKTDFRAVFKLKDDVKVIDGTGQLEDPYILGV